MREQYVLVAGSPRSGTTLLRTILKGSSALVVHAEEPLYILELHQRYGRTVTNVPEATEFVIAHKKFPKGQIDPHQLRDVLKGQAVMGLAEFLRTCYRLLRGNRPEAPVLLKHPSLLLHLDLVKDLLPDVSVMHIVRDPRANAFSQRNRWPSTSLWSSATGWQSYVDAGETWQRRRLTPYTELRYEDLVESPETWCGKICDFLEIPLEPAMLAIEHFQKDWDPTRPGEGARRRYEGFERERIDKWRTYMKPVEVRLIENQCHRGMARFEYELTHPEVPAPQYLAYYLNERRRALQKSYKRLKRRFRTTYGPGTRGTA